MGMIRKGNSRKTDGSRSLESSQIKIELENEREFCIRKSGCCGGWSASIMRIASPNYSGTMLT